MNGTVKVCTYIECILLLADRKCSGFDRDHNSRWGKLHRVEDVKIEWHGGVNFLLQSEQGSHSVAVPSNEEISFILEILRDVVSPALDKVEALLQTASSWDGIARNDFCR